MRDFNVLDRVYCNRGKIGGNGSHTG
jgi:hypothetical protein